MIGGYEQMIQMPSMGMLLDSNLAQSYIAGLREQYNLARDDWKEFQKDYGDFYSMSDVDNNNYYNMTKGAAQQLFNSYGNSLLRSAEGRAAIQNMIAGVDKKAIANMKASADAMKEFVKNRDALAAQGKYNALWDSYYSDMTDPSSWDSTKRVWTRTAPSEFKTLHELTKDEFEKMSPTELLGAVKGPDGAIYIQKGVSNETASLALSAVLRKKDAIPGMRMYEDLILKEVLADPKFRNASSSDIQSEVQKRWMDQLVKEQAMYMQPTYEISKAWENAQKLRQAAAGRSSSTELPAGRFSQGMLYAQGYGANMLNKTEGDVKNLEQLYRSINAGIYRGEKGSDYFSMTGINMVAGEMMMYTGREDKMLENKLMLWDPSAITLYSANDLARSTATAPNIKEHGGTLYFTNNKSSTAELNRIYKSFINASTLKGTNKTDKQRVLVLSPAPGKNYINPTLVNGHNTPFGKMVVKEVEITTDSSGKRLLREITDRSEQTPAWGYDRNFLKGDKYSTDTAVERINNLLPMVQLLGTTDLNGQLLPSEAAAHASADTKVTNSFNSNTGVKTGSVFPNVPSDYK